MKRAIMKRSVLFVVILVLFSAVMIAGATQAWFTDSASPIDNDFTAGTVEISADETITPPAAIIENWNPGDCAMKEYTIINTGTKSAYIRGIITGQWYEEDGITEWTPDPDLGCVTWEIHEDSPDPNWTKVDNKWYYNNAVPGTYTEADLEARQRKLTIAVCLDGVKTDNQYQGKVFKLFATYQAVQSSNDAINDVWPNNPYGSQDEDPPEENWDLWDSQTTYIGGTYVMYEGNVFVARHWTQGAQPGLMESPWQEIINEWRDFNEYIQGDQVNYSGTVFIARNWTKNNEPGLMESPWQENTDQWRDFNIYVMDDEVNHNSIRYVAKWSTQNEEPGISNAWQVIN